RKITISIRLSQSLLESLKVLSRKNDISCQSLVKMLLSERVKKALRLTKQKKMKLRPRSNFMLLKGVLSMAKTKENNATFEQNLFKAADKLRKNMDAAEYKHIVMGLIFLKYILDAFEDLHSALSAGRGEYEDADPEDADEYRGENVFWVPQKARWSYLHSRAKLPSIGKDIDAAMEAIEKENPTLKGILPKVYARPNLDKAALGGLLDLIGNIALGTEAAKSKDLLGRVYEYFLGEFANAEGKKGGQFYTPKSIVRLMVEMIEPYRGRVFDPACGSGGMFIMSEKFAEEHQGKISDISIYGQESNQTTYRLCRMNLAIRGIDGSQVKWNNEGSFLNDAHKDLKADFVLANPPFNDSDWSGQLLQNDPRWKYGRPPASNANFAWIQHIIYHLSPKGIMACVLANGSLSSQTNNEGEIRKALVENDLVDCIVALPKQLFYNTGIPACLWFISRKRMGNGDRKRTGQILFIDTSEEGYMEDRTHRAFREKDIAKIAGTYHQWRTPGGLYKDIKGFCKSVTVEEITKHKFVLTPGRYVGIKDEEDDGIPFEEKIATLTEQLSRQMEEEKVLDNKIKQSLKSMGFEI
ncbi:N-6 DNA methylase, partial [Thermodesulfovibrionales bacterium]|nr:N-6 DNA methylase [Thermodesulfovibrionales bacterium]